MNGTEGVLGSDETADRESDRRGERVGEGDSDEESGDSFPDAALESAAGARFSFTERGSPSTKDACKMWLVEASGVITMEWMVTSGSGIASQATIIIGSSHELTGEK